MLATVLPSCINLVLQIPQRKDQHLNVPLPARCTFGDLLEVAKKQPEFKFHPYLAENCFFKGSVDLNEVVSGSTTEVVLGVKRKGDIIAKRPTKKQKLSNF